MPRSPLLIGATGPSDAITRLATARMTLGASALLTPDLAAKVFGVPAEHVNPATRTMARLFGVRQVVLGAWLLAIRDADDETRRRCMNLQIAVEVLDLAALSIPLVRRQGLFRMVAMSSLAGTCALLGWIDVKEQLAG